MEKRLRELSELKQFIQGIDKEMTMLLQSLQWNGTKLMEDTVKVTCRYDSNHKIPPDKQEIHEMECFLTCQGYSKGDKLLPSPVDFDANTLVKLGKDDITKIIKNAKETDPLFKNGGHTSEPCTLERLQVTYSADERRAIHDAVVEAVPFCHDLTDLALPSMSGDDPTPSSDKSRAEILAELRNMKRRRTKYRVAAKSRNYSDVLRDVIKTQMEHYTEIPTKTEIESETFEAENNSRHVKERTYSEDNPNKTRDNDRIDYAAGHKYNDSKREMYKRDRQNNERSRFSIHENYKNTTCKDIRHTNHNIDGNKVEFNSKDESREKHRKKSSRETYNDDKYRCKYNKEERNRNSDRNSDRNKDKDNLKDRYENKASSSKDYKVSHKSREDKYKEKYTAHDSRAVKEEGKYKRYYDDRIKETSYEGKSKQTKY